MVKHRSPKPRFQVRVLVGPPPNMDEEVLSAAARMCITRNEVTVFLQDTERMRGARYVFYFFHMTLFRKLQRRVKANLARVGFLFSRFSIKKQKNTSVRVRGLIRVGNDLLAVRHHKYSQYYSLPGGGVESGETLEEALSRELQEELGVPPVLGDLFLVNQHFDADKKVHAVEFIFEVLNGEAYRAVDLSRTSHGHEIYELTFLSVDGDEKIRPFFLKDEIRKDREYSTSSLLHTSIHS
jgi:ADP-ribose pyrophosphatase YjhB (NUDIX family)